MYMIGRLYPVAGFFIRLRCFFDVGPQCIARPAQRRLYDLCTQPFEPSVRSAVVGDDLLQCIPFVRPPHLVCVLSPAQIITSESGAKKALQQMPKQVGTGRNFDAIGNVVGTQRVDVAFEHQLIFHR